MKTRDKYKSQVQRIRNEEIQEKIYAYFISSTAGWWFFSTNEKK